MLWDGNRQAQEYTDTHVFTTVYDQDSFEPVMWIDPFGLSHAKQLARNMNADPLSSNVKLGQSAHHIVQETRSNQYITESKRILTEAEIDYKVDSANGAALWGTHPKQHKKPGHPGNKSLSYHGGNVHAAHSDQRIMKLLQRAEKSGKPKAVENMLRAIGRKMEAGRWRTPKNANGRGYRKPKC